MTRKLIIGCLALALAVTCVILAIRTRPTSGLVIDMNRAYAIVATNQPFNFTRVVNSERENSKLSILYISNASGLPMPITLPASVQNMIASEGQTVYVTNIGLLLVKAERGRMEFLWKPLQ